ncbi:uncharacterized protein BCR38DRAFT_489048 [Pseudomassariella vexata]|uniref:Uncharacterized protein n=1 Tax=Pseudomassariella vexata TaxID=1141098 RepID=A0A1Y2DJI2_9PEZI|nr:uncharacterized protein BCR38DRAFT_489048 [Pseudomassariella vexata]ORY59316.1 hypothetical protein BCR38DRAFT_489048 [Pseudomassariella vexata]
MPTVILATWAILTSDNFKDDVVFHVKLSSHSTPADFLVGILEPTIDEVSVRIKLVRKQPIGEFLRKLQAQHSYIIAYEQADLNEMTMLVICERHRPDMEMRLGTHEDIEEYKYFNNRALLLDGFSPTTGEEAQLVFSYDANVVEDEQSGDRLWKTRRKPDICHGSRRRRGGTFEP